MIGNAGIVTVGVRQKSSSFIPLWHPKVRAAVDATIAAVKQ
jgi:hypothetical protein